jgi:hypothetical protein
VSVVDGEDLRERTALNQVPFVQDADAVGDVLDVMEHVRRKEDSHALALQDQEQVAEYVATDGIEPVHRLVEDHEAGSVQERGRDPHPLQHAARVAPQSPTPRVLGEVNAVQGVLHPPRELRPHDAVQFAAEAKKLSGRQIAIEARRVGQEAQGPAGRHATERKSQDLSRSAGGSNEAEQDLDRRRLARAVRAEESEDLPFFHGEVQTLQRHVRSSQELGMKRLPDVAHVDELLRMHSMPPTDVRSRYRPSLRRS